MLLSAKEAVAKVGTRSLLSPFLPPQVPGDLPHCDNGSTDIPSGACGLGYGLWLLEEEAHGK